eukprot:gene5976-6672_t
MNNSEKAKDFRRQLDKEYNETIPGKGAKTSDYYSTSTIPERFNNPDLMTTNNDQQNHNAGNPVFTCSTNLDKLNSAKNDSEDMFHGYVEKQQNPMYMTTNKDYGSRAPNVHTMPNKFCAKSQTFSDHLGMCGMYRNHSLNTSVDKSRASNHHDGLF